MIGLLQNGRVALVAKLTVRRLGCACLVLCCVFSRIPAGQAQTIDINVAGKITLDAFLNYVSKRLGTQFEYTAEIGNRSIVLRTPKALPIESLPALVNSILRTESLALTESDVSGWKRIVDVRNMLRYAPPGNSSEVLSRSGAASPVTQVFVLENASATSLATVLKPFLTENGSNLLSLPEVNILIVSDYAASVKTVADLIQVIDQPGGLASYEFYEVQNQQAATLAEQVRSILADQQASLGSKSVSVFEQPQTNRIVIAGRQTLVTRTLQLLRQLDVALGITTEVYRIKHTSAERVDKLAVGFIENQDSERVYQSTVDEEGNLLIVKATPEVHRQVVRLIAQIDVPIESSESPIQFYKLKNASAIEVLYTLLALQEASGSNAFSGGVIPAGFFGPLGGMAVPGGYPMVTPRAAFPFGNSTTTTSDGPALQTMRLPLTPGSDGMGTEASFIPERANPLARRSLAEGSGLAQGWAGSSGLGMPLGGGLQGAGGSVATLPGGARVSADISTNSLIVVAPANVQDMYAELIRSLDQRRPQVLIEAKIIAVDTSDDFSLGVEVSIGDRQGAKRLFEFTSFGLSEVDAETGALTIIPGLGFNGTLVDPDVADVVVRALSAHRRARVLAAPKILVNDNSTGKLESVSSIPFASVNASQTVSTTSLGGDQQAGTIITATPHINEDDHLQLEFDVEFSTFSGAAGDGLPPPRQIDRVGSTVTIPDGKTVVVGGLKRVGENDTFTGLPWAEKIPILRELTSRTDRNRQTTSFFLFIRPVILRDSRFADLRFLSDKEAGGMCIPGDYPASRPELIP